MIIAERNYCIYCRGELIDEQEISNEYHTSCRNEFQLERIELDIFDQIEVLNFKKQTLLKMITKVVLVGIILLIDIINLVYFFTGYFFVVGLLLISCLLLYIVLEIRKLDYVRSFCDLVIKLQPQYQFLSNTFGLAILGDIYIAHRPTTFNCNYFYLVKFFDSSFIENNSIILPSPKLVSAFNKEDHSIKLARFRETCQIPYNSLHSRQGDSIAYCIQFSEVTKRYEDVSFLVFQMNRETPNFAPDFKELSKVKLLLAFLIPLVLLALFRNLARFFLLR